MKRRPEGTGIELLMEHADHDDGLLGHHNIPGAAFTFIYIHFNCPTYASHNASSTSALHIPSLIALNSAFCTFFQDYLIPCKKLFSLIFLLLAFLIAVVNPSLAFNALSLSSSSIPAGRSIDCSSSGTWTSCAAPWEPVLSARAAFEARRRCFFDFAAWFDCQFQLYVIKSHGIAGFNLGIEVTRQ